MTLYRTLCSIHHQNFPEQHIRLRVCVCVCGFFFQYTTASTISSTPTILWRKAGRIDAMPLHCLTHLVVKPWWVNLRESILLIDHHRWRTLLWNIQRHPAYTLVCPATRRCPEGPQIFHLYSVMAPWTVLRRPCCAAALTVGGVSTA